MNPLLDVTNSTLASTIRMWRGLNARPAASQPALPLELYEFEACPYCRLVREVMTELDLDAMIYPTPHGGKRYRPLVVEAGGKSQFPYLKDPNTGAAMYESADIIDYLYKTYAGRTAPAHWRRALDVPTSFLSSAIRLRAGARARPSKAPAQPLELFSFESSPFSRRVRELLCELEIPYMLRNTGKAMLRDIGPPQVRKTLFPNLPVRGRNRRVLLERTGKVQLPFLIDRNTGVEMFESDHIRTYLMQTYAQ